MSGASPLCDIEVDKIEVWQMPDKLPDDLNKSKFRVPSSAQADLATYNAQMLSEMKKVFAQIQEAAQTKVTVTPKAAMEGGKCKRPARPMPARPPPSLSPRKSEPSFCRRGDKESGHDG